MKNLIYQSIIKLIAIALLFIATLDMPMIYYHLFKLGMCMLMGLSIYLFLNNKETDHSLAIAGCGFIAIIFNPIFKPNYGKADWIVVDDILIAIFFIWIGYEILNYVRNIKKLKKAKKELYIKMKSNDSLNLF